MRNTEYKKKVWTIIWKSVATIFGILIVLVLCTLIYAKSANSPDPKKYAKYWPNDLTYQQADSIAIDLVTKMTLEEKIGQMKGDYSMLELLRFVINFKVFERIETVPSGENKRLHIPPFTFSDGPRGVVVAEATSFPVAMARGATWDQDLQRRVGDVIGSETRAAGANYSGAVCINVLRHPAWGRAQETFGEDPWLLGEMSVYETKGIQKHNVMACAKHFAANSIEISRFKVNVDIDERTLQEVYLPHFKRVVDEGNISSVMSAYNKVRNVYAGENKYLLSEVLRNQWKFKGFVTSDWVYGVYNGANSVMAGLDVEMPLGQHYNIDELQPALQSGKISITQINEIVRRVLRTKLLYVTATDKQAYPKTLLASSEHQQLAQEVSEKSMVLLKNSKNVLPLNASKIKTLAVIGVLADTDNIGDHGSSWTKSPKLVRILQGLQAFGKNRFKVVFDDGADIESAKKVAKDADAVVFVVGYDYNDEGEYLIDSGEPYSKEWGKGGDRPNLFLKPHDQELLKQVLPINLRSVVTLIGGSAIMTNGWDHQTSAILMAWYPGMMGGNAFANVLFGKVNPSGRLPFTIPKREKDLPFFRPDIDTITYGYYHGYTLLDKKKISPAYPFGYGLSYTSFKFDNLKLKASTLLPTDSLYATVEVTNTGQRAGEEVVQLYVGFKHSKVDRPIKLLRGFKKVLIAPGEKKTVSIAVAGKDLAWYNPTLKRWVVDAMPYEVYMGSSSAGKDLVNTTFTITRQLIK